MNNLIFLSHQNIDYIIMYMYELMYVLNYDDQYIDYSYNGVPKIKKEVLLKDGITPSKIRELKEKLIHLQQGIAFYNKWNYLPEEYWIDLNDLKLLMKICHWFIDIHYECNYEELKRRPNLTWEDEQLIHSIECIESHIHSHDI